MLGRIAAGVKQILRRPAEDDSIDEVFAALTEEDAAVATADERPFPLCLPLTFETDRIPSRAAARGDSRPVDTARRARESSTSPASE